jgi:uncharacterized membrane protein
LNLEKKLNSWLRAEIIDKDTAENIRHFESKSGRNGVFFVLSGLGGLALGAGVIALVASNWELLPAWMKLLADILIMVALSFGIVWTDATAKYWQKETLIIVYYLVFLASIGLVGQVYQLGAPIYQGMILWTLGSAPLVLMGVSRSLAVFWLVGVLTTYACIIEAFIGSLEPLYKKEAIALFTFLPPFILLLISSSLFFQRVRPQFVSVFKPTSVVWMLVLGFFSQFFWYQKISEQDVLFWSPLTLMVVTVAFVAFYKFEPVFKNLGLILILRIFLIINSLLVCLPWVLPRESFDLVGVTSHFILCGILGWIALKVSHRKLFNWMAGLVGFRIVTVYFEVFGSLLETGIGLIATGIFILAFVWGFLKKFPRWETLISRQTS